MKFIRICLLFVIFTLFALAVTKRSRTHSRSMVSNSVSSSSTSYSETNNKGSIFYLDRHEPYCSRGAITYFKLERRNRDSDDVRYRNTCVNSDAINIGKISNGSTGYNTTSGKLSINYLDRHNVMCEAGTVLRSFRMVRKPSDNSKIRYNYTCVAANTLCCKTYTTGKSDMADKSAYYLDRQGVGKENVRDWAMRRFKLNSSYKPDRISYTYEMCKLRDEDAYKASTQAKANLAILQNSMNVANRELELKKNEFEAAQQRQKTLMIEVSKGEALVATSEKHSGLEC